MWQQYARLSTHLVVWSVVTVPVLVQISRGWRALGDDATIALHSFQVLSLHSPLVGMFSSTSTATGHYIYDPGPLQFWLLTLPVHVDPQHGVLWGAALWCGLALSLAVEALWAAGKRAGCILVAVFVVLVGWLIPEVFIDPTWDPNLSFIFAVVTCVLAFAVACGAVTWWPWVAFTASVAVQSEFFYGVLVVAMVVLSLAIALYHQRRKSERRYGWLVAGMIVGAVCWAPAVLQQIFGRRGNLVAILTASRRDPLGIGFGLRALSLAFSVRHPIWTRGYGTIIRDQSLVTGASPALGAIVILALAAVTYWAWRSRRTTLAAGAGVTLVASVCLLVTLAQVPANLRLNMFRYFLYLLLPVGLATWMIGLGTIGALVATVWPSVKANTTSRKSGAPILVGTAGVCFLAISGWSLVGLVGSMDEATVVAQDQLTVSPALWNRMDEALVARIERLVPKGPVYLVWCKPASECSLYDFAKDRQNYHLGAGAFWMLSHDGWRPALSPWFSYFSGMTYHVPARSPSVSVAVSPRHVIARLDAPKA